MSEAPSAIIRSGTPSAMLVEFSGFQLPAPIVIPFAVVITPAGVSVLLSLDCGGLLLLLSLPLVLG